MRADGTRIRELSTPEAGEEDHYPTWSPDGTTVVFMRSFANDAQTPTELMAVDVASGAERVVYRFPEWAPGAGDPKFSPSGRRATTAGLRRERPDPGRAAVSDSQGAFSRLTEDPALMEPTALLCGSGERRNERARLARR
jgi:dipeptidyl aminopeptidase/acylaminoacyl peptidase